MKNKLDNALKSIKTLDKVAMCNAEKRLDSLIKPPKSLGDLENIAIKLAGISGDVFYNIDKRTVIIMASDNGVVEEKISLAPASYTLTHTLNFNKGTTGVSVLAKLFNADLKVVDIGINGKVNDNEILDYKIANGTKNITKEKAMTEEELLKAIFVGINLAKEVKENGTKIIALGEMGIGNTTTSSAVLCALLGFFEKDKIETVVGHGAGLSKMDFENKVDTIYRAINLHKPFNGALDILEKVGGFDIAALCGVCIGGALVSLPVIIDGFISVVAALCAKELSIKTVDYMIFSHCSAEKGYLVASKALGLKPYIYLNMRLGEGSGAVLMLPIIDAACSIIKNMGTFEELDIGKEYLDNIKDKEVF